MTKFSVEYRGIQYDVLYDEYEAHVYIPSTSPLSDEGKKAVVYAATNYLLGRVKRNVITSVPRISIITTLPPIEGFEYDEATVEPVEASGDINLDDIYEDDEEDILFFKPIDEQEQDNN